MVFPIQHIIKMMLQLNVLIIQNYCTQRKFMNVIFLKTKNFLIKIFLTNKKKNLFYENRFSVSCVRKIFIFHFFLVVDNIQQFHVILGVLLLAHL